MNKDKEKIIRNEVAKLYVAAGCSCCRDDKAWEEASTKLAKLLRIPQFDDKSGYDFYKIAKKAEFLKANK